MIMKNDPHEIWMKKAFLLAEEAFQAGEVPVGAVVVHKNRIIGKGNNHVERLHDPTAHAEMIAITAACEHLQNWRLTGAVLYVTKEPCLMCAGAVLNARISKVVFSAPDEKEGAAVSRYDVLHDHRKCFVEVIPDICREEGQKLLSRFFSQVRETKIRIKN
ncbi:MAG: nucleoside deaminase [Candidatus Aureabacteria bacterium]|nr:nucleoside deaminase [Candidatus Auribacterota bacterium]